MQQSNASTVLVRRHGRAAMVWITSDDFAIHSGTHNELLITFTLAQHLYDCTPCH